MKDKFSPQFVAFLALCVVTVAVFVLLAYALRPMRY